MALNDKEIWKPITHIKGKSTKKYAVSSKGRLASYDNKIDERFVLKQHLNGGFPMATIHVDGNSKALFVHKAVGSAFVKKTSSKHTFVLHIDHNKSNNSISNLKWATRKEQIEHNKKNPKVLEATARKVYTGATARKLTEKKVISLKNEIWNPKRKLSLKQLADKYGIAEMNLYRIKNGTLWFHVHVEGEPIHDKYKKQLKNIEFHQKATAKKAKTKPETKKPVAKPVAKKTVKTKPIAKLKPLVAKNFDKKKEKSKDKKSKKAKGKKNKK